MWTLDF